MAEILSLTTHRKHRIVGIDGNPYEMLDRDELPLAQALGLSGLAKECQKASDNPEPEQVAALCKGLKVSVRIMLPGLPAEVEDKLTDTQRLNLLTAFCTAPATPAPAGPVEPAPTPEVTP